MPYDTSALVHCSIWLYMVLCSILVVYMGRTQLALRYGLTLSNKNSLVLPGDILVFSSKTRFFIPGKHFVVSFQHLSKVIFSEMQNTIQKYQLHVAF